MGRKPQFPHVQVLEIRRQSARYRRTLEGFCKAPSDGASDLGADPLVDEALSELSSLILHIGHGGLSTLCAVDLHEAGFHGPSFCGRKSLRAATRAWFWPSLAALIRKRRPHPVLVILDPHGLLVFQMTAQGVQVLSLDRCGPKDQAGADAGRRDHANPNWHS